MKTVPLLLPIFFGLLWLPTAGCCPALDPSPEAIDDRFRSRVHAVYPSTSVDRQAPSPDDRRHDAFDFQTKGPSEFLEFLSFYPTTARDFRSYTVWGTHRGWIRQSDVPALIEQLDSTKPCAPVHKAISSFLGTTLSTVGREAAFLLEGFRSEVENTGYRGYPPSLNSNRGFTPDREDLLDWWEKYQAHSK